ncbi:glycosyltransferase family 8 protein [Phlebiopsis gigantea 11061_1 CR5-6]|uniref:Glycosyltransferase family 8 protein n=1 Tax=Phlebiopsis gigantea (strain 11061_1 CR5-6) TaxID=745531 RepID=A0A0C3S926_PHLG1|nr:glycosyltransferase family 8 protein [Phlebiopsis gigantea 11061_1 CR5-6]
MSTEYIFTATQDWFSFNADRWRGLFRYVDTSSPRVLEIGSWEGRSAVFLLNELCVNGGSIICIDHFDLMNTEAGRDRHKKVMHNLSITGKPFRVIEGFSFPSLMTVLEEQISVRDPGFDWVYVDGSHEADDTLLDGELSWRLAKKGAIFIFDDYRWNKEPEDSIHHPKRGIDAFMALHSDEFEVISSQDEYQMILRKTSEMRIGFLVKDAAPDSSQPMYNEMHVVLTIDSSYAMPAAVTIQSVLQHTKGRITLYIVDLGLTSLDKERLRQLTTTHADVTLMFLDLPRDHPSESTGASWAKIAMIPILPVERALYLDADVLVCTDLRAAWNVDLAGKPVGAVIDVGYPQGHPAIERGPYFNAGVLLIDLAQARAAHPRLVEAAMRCQDSLLRDQDALNTVFRDNWCMLDVAWNAQGLGTYAKHPSAERDALDLRAMEEAAIVHFTGPVNPDMAAVLNPHVQPYTAKPWGYAGAPGHPYAEEWWAVLETTEWRGYRQSAEYLEYCSAKREEAGAYGIAAFHRAVGVLSGN